MKVARAAATAVETGATAAWVGAAAGFAFVSAPIAFALVTDRNVFAELTERSLERVARLSYIAGGIAAAIAFGRAGLERNGRTSDVVRGLAAGGALALIAYHQRAIVPAMTRAQIELGRFEDVADDDPKRMAYRALHKRSTRFFGTALLLGVVQLALASTRPVAAEPGP